MSIDLLSTDSLIDMLARVGIGVQVVLKLLRPRRAVWPSCPDDGPPTAPVT